MACDNMQKSMHHYENMRDSGVEWIGMIPSDWETKRLKFLGVARNGLTYSPANISDKSSGTLVIRSSNIQNGKLQFQDNVYVKSIIPQDLMLHQGDIVICARNGSKSLIGKSAYVDSNISATFGAFMMVFRTSVFEKKYIYWLLNSGIFNYYLGAYSTTTINQLTRENINNMYVPFCPFPMIRSSISNFLEEKCKQIDAVITEVKLSLNAYSSWKSSIIYEAVTKGLDPNTEMKDSGIEWIGKIPVNSFVTRLKYIVEQIQSGTSVNSGQSPAKDEELGILKTSCVSKYFFNPNENKSINRDEYSRATCSVKKGTIIVSRMNTPELVGACGYVTEDYPNLFLPDRLWQVSFKEDVNVRFVWYFLQSHPTRQYYASLATGTSSSMQNISQAQFLNAPIIMLSETEQRKVVAFLDKKCEQIEELIAEKAMLISDLETYKKSLIYEVVTGKRKVI